MEKKIKECIIEKARFRNVIYVVYDDCSSETIGSYFPDELYYSEDEFIGLTRRQASDLMDQKDKNYLRR